MALRFLDQPFQWDAVIFGGLLSIGTILRMTQVSLSTGIGLLETLRRPGIILMLCTCTDVFLGALHRGARIMQPVFFLALVPFCFNMDIGSIYGLGFFAMGVLLLFRLGFYEHRRVLKYLITVAYIFFWVLWFAFHRQIPLIDALAVIFFIIVFIFLLCYTFSDKLMVYLKEPREKLSLSGKGLSEAERTYVKAILAGGNYKQIAFDYEIKESTVRNTVARAYKKLGVSDHTGLIGLASHYDISD